VTQPDQTSNEGPLVAGRGRLAQVLATRGGTASPESPFRIEHREALIYMLCQAAELEHGIMCQYLFAAFSLKQRADEGLSDAEVGAVQRWRRAITHVATQEMLHLALVHNLLSAIGAAPHLARPNLPHPADHYPPGVQLALVPFGREALQHFMYLERPEGMDLDDADGLVAVGRARPQLAGADIVPRSQDFATIGHLYRSIEQGIAHLADIHGEHWLFVGPPRAQATEANFQWPQLVAVTDLASAQRAIDTILDQGEGPRGDWRAAHFGQFVEILDEYDQLCGTNPGFDPVRPVMAANVRPNERGIDLPLITDTVTARCADLFNVGYEILLQILERYFAHTSESDAQLATLADVTLSLMFQVIRPLGDLITTLPVGEPYDGKNAGPSFELFYETDYLMPHREAAWALLSERLDEAAQFCERIRSDWADAVGDRLAPVGAALSDMAASLGARVARQPLMDDDERTALRQRADDLAHSTDALVCAAHHLTTRALAGEIDVEARTADRVARRLVESVLRPLDAAPSDESEVDESEVDVGSNDETLEFHDEFRELARHATRRRARLGASASPGLMEAAAALQDLACVLAPSGAPATPVAEFRAEQASLASAIEPAPNGPYLVTNAERLTDWLGQSHPTRPQMALCRCGQSAIKPLCDGTHAAIGFTDAKDPKRIADRRDTYHGVQVMILDNRGTCQHSGLCTDRLAAVFRLDEEPFVAPSGGRMDEIIRAVRDCPSGALSYAVDGREARDDVDWHDTRQPTIEVTKDGPYRVRGGIPLSGVDGNDVPRNDGASYEHYALCRCGHSQNKPFCSGMHWYIDFRDPVPDPERTPTLFEWCGGLPALTRMTRLLYEKHIPADPILAPRFAQMTVDYPQRVAETLAAAFGGPARDSGDADATQPLDEPPLSDDERARWVELVMRSADEARLPTDPQFLSAFHAYLEWRSRNPTATAPRQWDWGPAGAPDWPAPGPLAPNETEPPVVLPGDDEAVSFERHIKVLFRDKDRQSMHFAFDLWSYDDVAAHADAILEQVGQGSMPCDGAWPAERVEVFRRWIDSGKAP
jgi:CDGSH-type Zn-finger protein/truncated hemoglobin YjbI